MAGAVFANADVTRNLFGFLEATPKLVAAVVSCSVDIATPARMFVAGFSKSDMLRMRAATDSHRAALHRETMAAMQVRLIRSVVSETRLETQLSDALVARDEAEQECADAEAERDSALAERCAMETAFAEHVDGGSRSLIGSTITLRRRLLVAEGARDRLDALNQRLYARLWAAETERDAALARLG